MKVYLKLFQFFMLVSLAASDYRNILRLCKIECEFSENLMSNYSCKIKVINRIRTAIYMDMYLKRTADNILMNMQIFRKNTVKYLPYMVNTTFNACQLAAGASQSYFAKFMIDWIKPHSNLNHPCPYNDLVYIKRLEPFADNIPGFISAGDYRLDLNIYEKSFKNRVGVVRGYGTMSNKPFITQDIA